MSETLPACPECSSPYTYAMDPLLVCPECGHEWNAAEAEAHNADAEPDHAAELDIKDSVGNILQDGDTVTITKTMKVKGSQTALKAGTTVRGIRIEQGSGDHDLSARVPGFGQMELKSSIVKKI